MGVQRGSLESSERAADGQIIQPGVDDAIHPPTDNHNYHVAQY